MRESEYAAMTATSGIPDTVDGFPTNLAMLAEEKWDGSRAFTYTERHWTYSAERELLQRRAAECAAEGPAG